MSISIPLIVYSKYNYLLLPAFIAALAADKIAIGTLYGEQDT